MTSPLDNNDALAASLNRALAEENMGDFAHALEAAAHARGVGEIAKAAGLEKAGDLRLSSVMTVLKAIGFQLRVQVA
jgi:DNA-binding phage protein